MGDFEGRELDVMTHPVALFFDIFWCKYSPSGSHLIKRKKIRFGFRGEVIIYFLIPLESVDECNYIDLLFPLSSSLFSPFSPSIPFSLSSIFSLVQLGYTLLRIIEK